MKKRKGREREKRKKKEKGAMGWAQEKEKGGASVKA